MVRADLQKVEEEFCPSDGVERLQPITEVGQYLRGSGGKRLRPALALLSSKMCGFEGPAAIRLATVVEAFIHTATLVHDDVIDERTPARAALHQLPLGQPPECAGRRLALHAGF